MTPGARVQAAIECLDLIGGGKPAEQVLTHWARTHRFAGSKDRAAIRDHVYDVLRCRRSYGVSGGGEGGRALMIGCFRSQGVDPDGFFTGEGYAPAPLTDEERAAGGVPTEADLCDMPGWIQAILRRDHPDMAAQIAEQHRHRAPVALRVRLRAKTREDVAHLLAKEGIPVELGPVPTSLIVIENARRVHQSPLYQSGVIEMQDVGAQALCYELPVSAGDRVLDYCAGGGGKILALGDRANIKSFAHDADFKRMSDIPERAKRAGQRVEVLRDPGRKAPYDVVLCDVPCSGSGTWRRTPEAKWSLTPERLEELNAIQAEILQKAASLVTEGGILAYATCSVFHCENNKIIADFQQKNPEWTLCHEGGSLPDANQDGFYSAHLRRV